MKWILAACLFVATYAVAPTPCEDKVYQRGWEHVYQYTSQVLTGLPTVDNQYSGFKVKADAHFQFVQNEGSSLKTILKLKNVVVYKVHTNIGQDVQVDEPLPESVLEVITNTVQGEQVIRQLSKPCTFLFSNGRIEELRVQENEPHWSVNYKKGLVHMLKINFKPSNTKYTEQEDDVMGRCESDYTLNLIKPYVRVHKVRNLNTCTRKPIVETGFLTSMPEGHSKNIMEPSVYSRATLYTEGERFAVKETELKSTYTVTLTSQSKDSAVTFTLQKLVCKQVHEIRSEISTDQVNQLQESLIYDVPTPIMPTQYGSKASFQPESYSSQEVMNKLDEVLTNIVNEMNTPFLKETIPASILKMTELLRTCTGRDIIALVRKYSCSDEICLKKKELLLDVIPSLPAESAGPEVVLTLVKERMVTGLPAAFMVNAMALTANPTPEVIDECLKIYKNYNIQHEQDKLVLRSLLLCTGTLANRITTLYQKIDLEQQTTKPILRGIISELRNMLRSTTKTEEKLGLLKTIGNFGEASLLPELKSIIENKQELLRVRAQAVYSLRKFAFLPEVKSQVMSIVMELYMNHEENIRMRTAAFFIIVKCRPEYRTWEMIGHKLETEPQRQIKSLVYSVYVKLAKYSGEERWCREQAEFCRRCLKWMKPIQMMPWDTRMMTTEVYSEMLRMGASIETLVMKSTESMLPRGLVTYLKGSVFGKYFNVMEAGVDTMGLEKLIKRIIHWFSEGEGEKTISTLMRIIMSTEEENVHGSRISEEIKNILRQLPVSEMDDNEFLALAYLKINTFEMQYITIRKDDLVNLFETQTDITSILRMLTSGKEISFTKVISMLDNSIVLPCPVGVPVYLNFTTIQVTSFKGFVQLEGLESVFRSMVRESSFSYSSFSNLRLKIKAVLSSPMEVIFQMGSQLDLIKTGSARRLRTVFNLPIDTEVSFEPTTFKLIMKNRTPEQKVDLFKAYTEIFTVFTVLPSKNSPSEWSREFHTEQKPIVDRSLQTRESDYTIPLLVTPVTIDVSSRFQISSRSYFPFAGKQELYITLNKKNIRAPTVVTEFDFSFLPKIFECNEQSYGNYRSSSRQQESLFDFTSDLNQVRPDEVFGRTCPAVKIPIVIFQEDNSPTRVEIQTTYIRSPDMMKHQLTIQTLGKKLIGLPYGFENIKLFTETLVNLEQMMEPSSQHPIIQFAFGFGISRFDENKFETKLYKDAPEHVFENQKSSGLGYRYTITIEHNELSQSVKDALYKVQEFLYPVYGQYMKQLNLPSSLVRNNLIKVHINALPEEEKVQIVLDIPSGKRLHLDVPLPLSRVPLVPLTSANPNFVSVVPNYVRNPFFNPTIRESTYGKCVLGKTVLKTYDGKNIQLPRIFSEPNCRMLVSADCSPLNLFALTMTPVDTTGQKTITLLVPGYTIEVVPKTKSHWFSWNKDVEMEIIVTPEQSMSEPLVVRSESLRTPLMLPSQQQPLYSIVKEGKHIVLNAFKNSLRVIFDGQVIKVEPTFKFQGRLCGLCADYNMDPSNDIPRISFIQHENLKKHFLENIIPSSQCRAQGL